MAEFPPNLDDGELWLPSVIFPDVGVCRRHHRQAPSAGFSYVDDLAEKLAAFSLLDRSHLLRPKPHLSDGLRCGNGSFSQFGPVVARETGAGMVYDGFCSPAAARWAMGAAAGGSRSVFPFSLAKPVQVDLGVMSRQQPGPVQGGRFVPVRTGGSGRECGGTRAFLPRVNKIEAITQTKKKASRFNTSDVRSFHSLFSLQRVEPSSSLVPSHLPTAASRRRLPSLIRSSVVSSQVVMLNAQPKLAHILCHPGA